MRVQGVDNTFTFQQQQGTKTQDVVQQDAQNVKSPNSNRSDAGQTGNQVPEDLKNLDSKKLDEAIDQVNKTMETYTTELRFSIHKDSGEVSVKVINTKDNSVIREIPAERVLDFVAYVKKMLKKMVGVLVDKHV